MRSFRIPLTADNQVFDIHLGGKHYDFELQWNQDMKLWVISIADHNTSAPLINGIPLTTGAELLEQFKYIGIPGAFICLSDIPSQPPTYETLGISSDLYFYSDEDYPDA